MNTKAIVAGSGLVSMSGTQCDSSWVRNRGLAARPFAALVMASAILWSVGCHAPPSRDNTLRVIDDEIIKLDRAMQREIRRCGNDQACIEEVRRVFGELKRKARLLRLRVIQEDWEDAREFRKKLRDQLIDLIPQYPDLREMLEDILRMLDDEEGELDMSATAGALSVVRGSQSPAVHINYDLAGWLDVSDWVVAGPMNFVGELEVSGLFAVDPSGVTNFSGYVTSGWITLALPDGTTIDAMVYNDTLGGLESTIHTVAGVGEVSLVLELDRAMLDAFPQWGVLIDSPTIIRLPIQMDGQRNISLSYGPARLGDLLPYEAWPASDYNGDGQLDEATDFAAFMNGWNTGEPLADSDFDDDFDQDDIDLWLTRFREDIANE